MTTPTTRTETYGRWTFTYYVVLEPYRGGPCCAQVDVHEGTRHVASFIGSTAGGMDETLARLRGYCEEWVKDREAPSRVEQRNTRTIGDRIKAGLAGEKGLR